MRINGKILAIALASLVALPANSAVMRSQTGVMTEDAQDFLFSFSGLPQSDGTGGFVTIASGRATTGAPADDGFDIDGAGVGSEHEFFGLMIDSNPYGLYGCHSQGSGWMVPNSIAGSTMNGNADCIFSLTIALAGALLDSMLSDGIIDVMVNMGAGVGHFGDGDELIVSLSYTDLPQKPVPPPGPAPVPLPASALLLLGGLAAVGAAARRRNRKS